MRRLDFGKEDDPRNCSLRNSIAQGGIFPGAPWNDGTTSKSHTKWLSRRVTTSLLSLMPRRRSDSRIAWHPSPIKKWSMVSQPVALARRRISSLGNASVPPMEETRRLRSRENRRYTRQPLRCRQLFLREKRMTPCVSRARGPIDGHIAEQFEIMGDDRSFPAGYPALGNANYERIGILTAKIRTFRVEKWMLLVKGLCGLPRIFARRSPFGVTQPFPKWFAGGEMFKVGLRSGPDVRWAVWRQAENIPETAQQHVPDAKTPPQAVNKEALLDGGAPPWR